MQGVIWRNKRPRNQRTASARARLRRPRNPPHHVVAPPPRNVRPQRRSNPPSGQRRRPASTPPCVARLPHQAVAPPLHDGRPQRRSELPLGQRRRPAPISRCVRTTCTSTAAPQTGRSSKTGSKPSENCATEFRGSQCVECCELLSETRGSSLEYDADTRYVTQVHRSSR